MCSIFGLGFQKGHKIKDVGTIKSIMAGLLKAGESRGRDAAGLAVTSGKKIVVLKDPITGSELANSTGFDKLFRDDVRLKNTGDTSVPTMSILGHCRAQTQGTYKNNDNNHPIVTEKVIGVHNGMISNDANLFSLFPDMKRKAEVDSEAIFRMMDFALNNGKSMKEAIQITGKQLAGWYACAAVSVMNPFVLWLFKDRTPVDVLYYQSVGLVIFATAKDMIKKATRGHSLGKPTVIPIAAHTGIGIDLWTGDFNAFPVEEDKSLVVH